MTFLRILHVLIFFCIPFKAASTELSNEELQIQKQALRKYLGNQLSDQDVCSFAPAINKLEPKEAAKHAQRDYDQNDIYFYSVADGFAPSRPGFEFEFSRCVIFDSKWKSIDVGGDAIVCKEHSSLSQKANQYVALFNREMTRLVRKDPKSYPCRDSINITNQSSH
ncbi:hypothetical protein [uncultured Shewanella sp.]|uniref:hypothetical protein n=1 Tax=uncultured Shewanella sp. TaxID=173975 RepID=UPI002632864A|nr:hypothetical protein [uncultured Shewanella sp.]